MNFSSSSASLLKPFLSSFTQVKRDNRTLTRTETKQYQQILGALYEDIKKVSKKTSRSAARPSDMSTTEPPQLPQCVLKPSHYFPESIRDYIVHTPIVKQIVLQVSPTWHIYLSFFHMPQKQEYDEYMTKLRHSSIWLNLCKQYATSAVCAQSLKVYIFLTPFAKHLPSVAQQQDRGHLPTLAPDQVNGAFTMDCAPQGEIVVYRAEEWFKVFLHETFHAFGMDMGTSPFVTRKLRELFPIQSDFSATEAYSETFARILNCAFCSFQSSTNKTTFLLYMEFCLQLERLFAIFQMHKVLRYMGLSYLDICGITQTAKRAAAYREDTNVFAYYILTAVFLCDYPAFLLLCSRNNTHLVQFPRTSGAAHMTFSAFIEEHYKNIPELKELHSPLSSELATTTRMSVL